MTSYTLAAVLLFAAAIGATPLGGLSKRATNIAPVISSVNFADPSIVEDIDGRWYAFATNDNPGPNVPVANARCPEGPWTVLSADIFPTAGAWSNGANIWAPDVRRIGRHYVLYYTATYAAQAAQHCVGAAVADNILGPYIPGASPLACPLSQGGAIDPSGFTDVDGTHYVVYKVDGNSIGNGGSCGNSVPPIVPTPLMLQQLAADGVTPVGDPIELLDRGDADGPLIEAPDLILHKGTYFLFFSSNCYSSTFYDVSYATASSVKGPFTKSSAPLMTTDNPFNITSPGGATATVDGRNMVFHAQCPIGRCMFESAITISGDIVTMG